MRVSDESDPFRERNMHMLDDFCISGAHGKRILCDVYRRYCVILSHAALTNLFGVGDGRAIDIPKCTWRQLVPLFSRAIPLSS